VGAEARRHDAASDLGLPPMRGAAARPAAGLATRPGVRRSYRRVGEKRLAARAAGGDEAAFAEIYRRNHQALFRYGLALLHDPEDTADVLQTTMAKGSRRSRPARRSRCPSLALPDRP
jgi:hypothetical protein